MSNILDLKVLLLSYISRLRLNILVHWKPLPLYKGHLTLRWNTSFGHRNSLWICRHCDEDSSLRRNVVKYWASFLQLCWSIHMTIDQGKKKREKKRERERERDRERQTDRWMDGETQLDLTWLHVESLMKGQSLAYPFIQPQSIIMTLSPYLWSHIRVMLWEIFENWDDHKH